MRFFPLLFFTLIIITSAFDSTAIASKDFSQARVATVLEAVDKTTGDFKEQIVKLKFHDDGEEIFITNTIPDSKAYAILAIPGKQYLIGADEVTDQIYIADYYREPVIYSLLGAFFLVVILFGGMKGLKSILCLVLSGLSIIYVLIPSIKNGVDPIPVAIGISAFSTAITMILIAGFSKKSLAATIGTTGGVAVAGIASLLVIKLAPLSGLASTEAYLLQANMPGINLDFQGILASGVLISSLGAAMDVAMSIASACQEIYEANIHQSKRELFRHAMNIGKDIMATMTDTLILAYAGASLPLFLLIHGDNSLRYINMEIIATELTAALCGSIGLVLAIPITAVVAVFLLKAKTQVLE